MLKLPHKQISIVDHSDWLRETFLSLDKFKDVVHYGALNAPFGDGQEMHAPFILRLFNGTSYKTSPCLFYLI